jgi:hypothetical protein
MNNLKYFSCIILLLLVCVISNSTYAIEEPKCEVGDAIYRDGVLDWDGVLGFIQGTFVYPLADPITGDVWHAGIYLFYDGEKHYTIEQVSSDKIRIVEYDNGTGNSFIAGNKRMGAANRGSKMTQTAREEIVRLAKGKEGDSGYFLWYGKSSTTGFRCDGFVEYVYEQAFGDYGCVRNIEIDLHLFSFDMMDLVKVRDVPYYPLSNSPYYQYHKLTPATVTHPQFDVAFPQTIDGEFDFEFNEPIAKKTLQNITILTDLPEPREISYTISDEYLGDNGLYDTNACTSAKLTPSESFQEGAIVTITVPVTVKDLAGNPIQEKFIKSWKIGSSSIDIVFCIDTTGSMYDDIDAVQAASVSIISEIAEKIPDFRVAVVDYRDFPTDPYGSDIDYPYNDVIGFTNENDAAVNAIMSLGLGDGKDHKESVYSALVHCIDANSLGGWRANPVKRAIILMGDAPPHDPEPFTGYTLAMVKSIANGDSSLIKAKDEDIQKTLPSKNLDYSTFQRARETGLVNIDKIKKSGTSDEFNLNDSELAIASSSPTKTSIKEKLTDSHVYIFPIIIGNDTETELIFNDLAESTGGISFKADYASDVVDSILLAIDAISDIPEYTNEPPAAAAGQDRTLVRTRDSGADVTLDGSGSSDPDGDALTYNWTWDGGTASGVSPTVSLPVGLTEITLTVSDGEFTDSDTVSVRVLADFKLRSSELLTFADANGSQVFVKLENATANIWFSGSNVEFKEFTSTNWALGDDLAIENIFLVGTSTKSRLLFDVADAAGDVEIGDITSDGAMEYIRGSKVNLKGDITIGGSLKELTFGDVNGPSLITVGPSGSLTPSLGITLKNVNRLDIRSRTPIDFIKASSWTNSRPIEAIIAESRGDIITTVASEWLMSDCGLYYNCNGADMNLDGIVNYADLPGILGWLATE